MGFGRSLRGQHFRDPYAQLAGFGKVTNLREPAGVPGVRVDGDGVNRDGAFAGSGPAADLDKRGATVVSVSPRRRSALR